MGIEALIRRCEPLTDERIALERSAARGCCDDCFRAASMSVVSIWLMLAAAFSSCVSMSALNASLSVQFNVMRTPRTNEMLAKTSPCD